MKKYLPLLFIPVLLIVGPACRKNKKELTSAIITGNDGRYCGCCGGLMITFTNDPQPYGAAFKLISNNVLSDLGNNVTFPVYVEVAWRDDPSKCGEYIIIEKLVKK